MYVVDGAGDTLYLAGERVEPGTYRRIDSGRVLHLAQGGYLPASLDGKVACYCRIRDTSEGFAQMTAQLARENGDTGRPREVVF